MKIALTAIMVRDQSVALEFYTKILGFVKKVDIPMGEYRWLTVTSAEGVEGIELLLEPIGFAPAQVYQQSLFEAGIPLTVFNSDDIAAEYERLKELGVVFRGKPEKMDSVTTVLFEDTCGNLICLAQPDA